MTVSRPEEGATAGAVYKPELEMVPTVAAQTTSELYLPVPETAAEHWLVWPDEMVDGLQVTTTAVIVDACDALGVKLKLPPVHPVIHNMPEKSRQSAALRSIVLPPLFSNL